MTILEENPIPSLVARCRKLDAQVKALQAKLKDVKAELEPIVEALPDRKWSDDAGYAAIISRASSISYDNKAVENLAQAWRLSEDSIMRSCGQMLVALRKEKSGYSYLQVK